MVFIICIFRDSLLKNGLSGVTFVRTTSISVICRECAVMFKTVYFLNLFLMWQSGYFPGTCPYLCRQIKQSLKMAFSPYVTYRILTVVILVLC